MPIIEGKIKTVNLKEGQEIFGQIEELTFAENGTKRVSVAKVTLFGPDFLHKHRKTEEIYIWLSGKGEIFFGEEIHDFGKRGAKTIIITPRTLHAARPKDNKGLVFLCVSAPPYSSADEIRDKRLRNW